MQQTIRTRLAGQQAAFQSARLQPLRLQPIRASKGFGTDSAAKQQESEASTSGKEPEKVDYAIEALEARIRSRRAKKIEAQVKVESAAVEAVKGDKPMTPQQQAEGNFVLAMLTLFGLVLMEGLLIAGAGFLPEEWDAFIQDVLYPNYTGTVALFLGASTLYGLWKIGKISLPFLGTAPAEKQE